MTEIAIVYFSGTGHTHLIAEAIEQGASQVAGTNVELLRITGDRVRSLGFNRGMVGVVSEMRRSHPPHRFAVPLLGGDFTHA